MRFHFFLCRGEIYFFRVMFLFTVEGSGRHRFLNVLHSPFEKDEGGCREKGVHLGDLLAEERYSADPVGNLFEGKRGKPRNTDCFLEHVPNDWRILFEFRVQRVESERSRSVSFDVSAQLLPEFGECLDVLRCRPVSGFLHSCVVLRVLQKRIGGLVVDVGEGLCLAGLGAEDDYGCFLFHIL